MKLKEEHKSGITHVMCHHCLLGFNFLSPPIFSKRRKSFYPCYVVNSAAPACVTHTFRILGHTWAGGRKRQFCDKRTFRLEPICSAHFRERTEDWPMATTKDGLHWRSLENSSFDDSLQFRFNSNHFWLSPTLNDDSCVIQVVGRHQRLGKIIMVGACSYSSMQSMLYGHSTVHCPAATAAARCN